MRHIRRHILIIVTLFTTFSCSGVTRQGIVFSYSDSISIFESADIKSKQIGYLQTGEIVNILDTTKEIFEIGTGYDSLCRLFPFVKVKNSNGINGWVSGEFIFKIIEHQKEQFWVLKAETDFSMNKHDYTVCLVKNYGIGSSNEIGVTGCEEFYPILLYDKTENKYYLIKNLDNPNSYYKYCILISDNGVAEELIDIIIFSDSILFKIKCSYQTGTGTYDTKIFFKDQVFYGKSIDFIRTEE